MAKRSTILGSRYQIAKILKQQTWTGDTETIAMGHEINRQSVVKELLIHIFLMSKFGKISDSLMVGAATSQYLSAAGANQAAHCIPGQVFDKGIELQKLPSNNEYLEVTLDCLFGTTDDIHSNFNKADSLAEDSGLRDALRTACNQAAKSGKHARFERAYQFYPFIENAFQIYKNEGLIAFETAITRLQSSLNSSGGDDLRLRNERITILRTYRHSLRTSQNSPETVLGLDGEIIWESIREG